MMSEGVSWGWAFDALVLTVFALAGVAMVAGLETMSWIAGGASLVVAVITLFRNNTSAVDSTGVGGERRGRLVLNRPQKAVLVVGLVVIIGATTLVKVIGPTGAGGSGTCPKPSGSDTGAPVFSNHLAAYPGLAIKSFNYSLIYGIGSTMELEPTGQITGPIPADHLLYPFSWADPASLDSSTPRKAGSGRYFWGYTRQIFPDEIGCWAQPSRSYGGYPGARGMIFRMYFGLVPRAQLHCLQGLVATEVGRKHGQSLDELTGCGVVLLGYASIPTQPE